MRPLLKLLLGGAMQNIIVEDDTAAKTLYKNA